MLISAILKNIQNISWKEGGIEGGGEMCRGGGEKGGGGEMDEVSTAKCQCRFQVVSSVSNVQFFQCS